MLVKVKWGKENYDVDVDTAAPVAVLKAQLQSLTSIPAEKQKIMGVKGGQLKDDANLADVGLTEGKQLLLVGSAEVIASPIAPVVFVEDTKGGFEQLATTTNGLINVGNTCYMNAAVQTLRMIPELREILAKATSPLSAQLLRLFQKLDATRDPVAPMELWLTLMGAFPNFAETDHGRPMQHDSQEAFASMLQTAIQQIAADPELKEKYGSLFTGHMQQITTIEGAAADAKPHRDELVPFQILPCNIGGEVQTLEAGLEQAMNESYSGTVDDGSTGTFKKVSRLAALPEYLIVHFVRFHWRRDINAKTKILKPITFPLVLDVQSLCTEELKHAMEPAREAVRIRRDHEVERRKKLRQKSGKDEPADSAAVDLPGAEKDEDVAQAPQILHNENGFYELCGVISHKGRDAESGHYVAWVLKAGTWLVVDDSNVAPVTQEDIRRLRGVGEAHIAYVLLYRTRDPVTKQAPLNL